MNIYFSPNDRNELNFPTITLSTNINNSITNTAELEKINPHIDDNLNKEEEDIEISEFYEKYKSKTKVLEKTKSQIKLNKVKVYFIVKSKIINGKEMSYALPIRNLDDLGNSILEKSSSFIASIFYTRLGDSSSDFVYNESNPGARPFFLEEVMDLESSYYTDSEFPLENLILPKKYVISRHKIGLVKEPKINNVGKMVLEEPKDELETMESFSYFNTEYEYNESMIDNTFLSNPSRYVNDIRQKKSFNGEKEETGFLSRLKDLNSKEGRFKLFNMSNIFSLVFGNRNVAADKNIIPVFSSLEDAQDLLITLLDEINQPFQIRRKIENPDTNQNSKNLSYLDDSFSFQNNYFFPGPKSKLHRAQDLLMRYGIIKVSDLSKFSDDRFYHENKYQTKGPFVLEDIINESIRSIPQQNKSGSKFVWREIDYLSFLNQNFPGQQEAYSWWESRHISDIDKGLLKKSQDIKIISMGLGDFLEFWNTPTIKNAEALFIPSSNELDKPLSPKKYRDKFYDYQQKFRESKKQDTENYIYEIKLSI